MPERREGEHHDHDLTPAGRDVAVRLPEERDYLDDGDPTKDSASRPDSL